MGRKSGHRGSRRHRMKRVAGKRTTVRAVFQAINKYPRGKGASVREIHRIIVKADKGPEKRSLSSVKLAIARAVRKGAIKAPKGWQGFRGIPVITPKDKERRAKKLHQADAKKSRSVEQLPQPKTIMPWFSSEPASPPSTDLDHSGGQGDTWGRSRSRGDGQHDSGKPSNSRKEQRRTKSQRGRSHSRKHSVRRPGRPKGRGKKDQKKKSRHANSSNSSNANADVSDNCNEEGNEATTQSSLWPSYCTIS